MSPRRIPTYRCYKPKNLGLVVLDGKQRYLGKYGTPESLTEYNRLVQEWLSQRSTVRIPISPEKAGSIAPVENPPNPLVNEVILAFLEYAQGHYRRPDGTPSGEFDNLRAALRPLRELYGYTPAASVGPLSLRAVRDLMIRNGLSRSTINSRINRIRRMFRWAVSLEMLPGSIVQSLEAVSGLQKGRSGIREAAGISPVSVETVEATLPFMPKPIAAMVRLQLLSGCRTGEILIMRGVDVTQGAPIWTYRPSTHKNSWRGQERIIVLGPRAQAIVREFLKEDSSLYLFSPQNVVAEFHASRGFQRRTKPTPSEQRIRRPRAGRTHAPFYNRRSYRQAICRACDRAFPHPTLSKIEPKQITTDQSVELKEWRVKHRWSPLQLRHTAATQIRARFGLEVAQIVLGHAKADVTQVYAERDLVRAQNVMAEIG
jgi:integrase